MLTHIVNPDDPIYAYHIISQIMQKIDEADEVIASTSALLPSNLSCLWRNLLRPSHFYAFLPAIPEGIYRITNWNSGMMVPIVVRNHWQIVGQVIPSWNRKLDPFFVLNLILVVASFSLSTRRINLNVSAPIIRC